MTKQNNMKIEEFKENAQSIVWNALSYVNSECNLDGLDWDNAAESYLAEDIAEQLAKQGRSITNAIDDRRKQITKPYLDTKKEIDPFAKQLTNNLDDATMKLRKQILKFKQEQEQNPIL